MLALTSLSLSPKRVALQLEVLAGWKAAGLDPVVLLDVAELQAARALWPRAEPADCVARGDPPRRLVSLHALLARAARDGDTAVLVANADCELALSAAALDACKVVAITGGMVYFVRWTYQSSRQNATQERWGIDGFMFRPDAALVERFDGSSLALGSPFWDYALPMVWLRMGRELYLAPDRSFYHLKHRTCWTSEDWHAQAGDADVRLGLGLGADPSGQVRRAAAIRQELRVASKPVVVPAPGRIARAG
jgi:hypothetical protein